MQLRVFTFTKLNLTAFFLIASISALSQPRAVPLPYSSTLKYNYVRVWEAAVPERDPNSLINRPVGEVMQTTQYLDGLGRPIQTVAKQMSPQLKDLVTAIEYDEFGRQKHKYLPFTSTQTSLSNEITDDGNFKLNPFQQQEKFMQTQYGSQGELWFYSQTEFDGSPLNTVTEIFSPGNSWAGTQANTVRRSVKMDYGMYDPLENVRIWNIDYAGGSMPTTASAYATQQLYKMVSFDETGKQIIEYKNKDVKTILKKVQSGASPSLQHAGWLCTYYVYDDFNQLRFIVPAKAVEYLDNNGWILNQNILDELCYQYAYDAKGRMNAKKVPGAGWQYMVYDQRDRLVFSQDANLDQKKQWLATIFDELNRPVITGMLEYDLGHVSLQNSVDEPQTSPDNIPVTGQAPSSVSADLLVSEREAGKPQYAATNSITIQPEFVSEPGAVFTAEIVTAQNGNSFSNNLRVAMNPIPAGYNFVALTTNHYDDYAWVNNRSYTDAYNSNLADIGTNIYAKSLPSNSEQQKPLTYGMVTGSRVRILEDPNNLSSGKWLTTVVYYDRKGNPIQTQSDNFRGATNLVVNRYDFTGKPVVSYVSHADDNNTYTVVSRQEFDKAGRLLKVFKNFNNTTFKQLAEYAYNESGQLKTKRLSPGYTGTGKNEIEAQVFDYNIQGSLIGINKDYALNAGNYNQWDNYFGMYLGYDNKDGVFAGAQYNGNITGLVWKSQGDNSPRKYDLTYDDVNRFTSALFKQKSKPTDAWSNAAVDLSVYADYEDGNGNLKSLKQMSVLPGTGIVTADDLKYFYTNVPGVAGLTGNRLKRVDDKGTLGTNNGLLSDFRDGSNAAGADDYSYDANGNLVSDLNKNITNGGSNGITYNYLDKPVKIVLQNKSVVKYTYDATGEKISKKVTNTITNTSRTTYYAGDFIYRENTLQYVLHEEGRLKIITPVSDSRRQLNAGTAGINWPGGKQGVFEYFIKDHLSNTRVVLTEEVQKEFYHATMEQNAANDEEPLFGKVNADGSIPADNELKAARYVNGGGATPWPNNTTDFVRLSAAQNKTMGPGMILKVMAGDMINAQAKYFYYQNNSTGGTNNPVADVLQSLVGAIGGAGISGVAKANSAQIQNALNLPGTFKTFIETQQPNSGNPGAPKAYLNIVFLDEQFKFIERDPAIPDIGTQFSRVSSANDANAGFAPMQQKAPVNGYVFVYLSNQSNESVYFDDFYVTQEHSTISEENHYYPHGLKIAAISSRAFNKLDNKYGYQGDYSEEESETGWNEFALRNYDPQIGRWTSADPYDEFASPYVGMGNDPVNNVDPSGGGVDLPEYIVRATVHSSGAGIQSLLLENILSSSVIALAGISVLDDFFRNGKGEVQYKNSRADNISENGEQWTNIGSTYSDEYGTFFGEGNRVWYQARDAVNTGQAITGATGTAAGSKISLGPVLSFKFKMDWDRGLIPKPFYLKDFKFYPGNGYALQPDPLSSGGYRWGFKNESIHRPAVDPIDVGSGLAYGMAAVFGRVVATTGGQLLLRPGASNLTQKGLEHIVARHWFTSGARGAGKFLDGTTATSLKDMISVATTRGVFRANTMGRAGTIAEYNFGRVIGTTSGGAPASSLRVIIGTNGNVITAFPF